MLRVFGGDPSEMPQLNCLIFCVKINYVQVRTEVRFLRLYTLLREMAGSPQLMCIHNVKHDWFSDSEVPHNTRHIALHDIVFRTS